ncbi:UDP-N-acetylglucosamine--N-acetylmuramyl-(pentapeptide) pyrophosphoryl-undecaprenol N-acetylglucosamine transferase MurG [Planctomycetes bacterium Poly30]|uniref:UDP-N-acetylglucosamine--N-acetylmuramyl-(pentapeptide) pyrophosphoryl-undecaprenol N-acetylglucosamine transferase n=1 Tax=Saltatorellus ferox TaxID=2528018 RepID=A0A518EVU4_9BACT|nr:UDP-N-acetylglucosamine--N-acetylmuramyl-(pentapeptide) pyrophosphoryl-undecaprenol N-acetylglucosamine transferase MurG [Planctomycetes bacterium Poly30]
MEGEFQDSQAGDATGSGRADDRRVDEGSVSSFASGPLVGERVDDRTISLPRPVRPGQPGRFTDIERPVGVPSERSSVFPDRLRLAIAGGGTGGHVVPGLHLLDHLRFSLADAGLGVAGSPGVELEDLLWFHSGRRAEDRCLAELDAHPAAPRLERIILEIEPKGGGAPSLRRLSRRMIPAFLKARRAMIRHRSQVLLGLGGFTTAPATLAARSLGIPVVLLEINATAGKATRTLGPICQRVLHAWRETLPPGREGSKHQLVGPPVAPHFIAPADLEACQRDAKDELGFDPDRPLLVVLGGSQGALGLNAFVRTNVSFLLGSGVQVLHQVGPGRRSEGATNLAGYAAIEYLDDVWHALVAADGVLCRGGASTLAEIGAVGTPAWVVPYPHHADGHQERNARQLDGGVRIVEEQDLDHGRCEELVRFLGAGGRDERERMRRHLRAAVPLNAASRIWGELSALSLVKAH